MHIILKSVKKNFIQRMLLGFIVSVSGHRWTQMDTNGHKLVTGPAGGSQTSEMKAYGLVSIIAFDDRWCY